MPYGPVAIRFLRSGGSCEWLGRWNAGPPFAHETCRRDAVVVVSRTWISSKSGKGSPEFRRGYCVEHATEVAARHGRAMPSEAVAR
jgi:hypothetical protein